MKHLLFTVKSFLLLQVAKAATYATTAGEKAKVTVSCIPVDDGSAQCCSTSSWVKIETNSTTATAFGSGDCVAPVSEGIYYGCLSSPGCTLDCSNECSVTLGVMDEPITTTTTTTTTTTAATTMAAATNTDATAPNTLTTVTSTTTDVDTTTMDTMPADESTPMDGDISDNSKSVIGASNSFSIAIVTGATTLVAMLIT